VRPDQLERRLRERLDALGPAPRAELLHVLRLPDFDRADAIGCYWGNPKSPNFAELLIDLRGGSDGSGRCRSACCGKPNGVARGRARIVSGMDRPLQVPSGMTLETDVAPTVWVDESLMPLRASGEGALVGEIIPTGFEAYARILHPASRRVGDRFEPITWSELARTRGKTIHPEVQLKALLGDEFRHSAPWGELPEEDSIPEPLRAPLVDTLRRFTARDDRCWCCIWEGYGLWFGGVALTRVDADSPAAMRQRRREAERRAERERAILEAIPKASIMGGMRECLVFTGSIDAILGLEIGGWSRTPNWWWPDDRAWIVVSELDAPSTYVGGSAELVRAIFEEPKLEAVPSDPTHRFDWDGDRINAPEGP